MNNVSLPPVNQIFNKPAVTNLKPTTTPFEAQESFSSVLKKSIEEVNNSQIESDKMTERLARGENVDLHQVMIASQKASVTMAATLEIRNKVIEAYQEMMRMPV